MFLYVYLYLFVFILFLKLDKDYVFFEVCFEVFKENKFI